MLPHGTSACLDNPNDACCFSCLQHISAADPPPTGCTAPESDPNASCGPWLKTEDPENLRCFNQKTALRHRLPLSGQALHRRVHQARILDRSGTSVEIPLYRDLQCKRSGLRPQSATRPVFLTGIVGVPWQDIAVTRTTSRRRYKTAKQIARQNIWQKILGNPSCRGAGRSADRSAHDRIGRSARGARPADSAANADPIHGHEWDTSKDSPANRDLQYACIFPLPMAGEKRAPISTDCDCADPDQRHGRRPEESALPGAGGFTTTPDPRQSYPGIRELAGAPGLERSGHRRLHLPGQRHRHGRRPTSATVRRSRPHRAPAQRAPRTMPPARAGVDPATKQVPCAIIEAFNPPPGCTTADAGRVGRPPPT